MRKLARSARAATGRIGRLLAVSWDRVQDSWARLLAHAHGNVSVLFGFSAIALVGGVGMAFDTAVAYNVRSQLAAASDAAALAGARAFASPTRDEEIEAFFNANFDDGYMGSELHPLDIDADPQARTVMVTATVTIPTFFMRLFGTESTEISASTEATLSSRDVEVSLVLDVTGSMNTNNKIADLKVAAKELVDIVVQDLQDPFYSKVALVPYSIGVNVGDLADEVRGTYIEDATCVYPDEPVCETFRFPNATWHHNEQEQDISTCVTERIGPHAYDDTAPSMALVGRNFPRDDHNPCLEPEIVPLSSNKSDLEGAIEDLEAVGSTAGQIGIAWGWYMISPNFGYLFSGEGVPVPYGTVNLGQEVLKVVVIMTDGEFNTVYFDGVIARDSTTGSGDVKYKIDEDATNGDGYHQSEQLCNAMKAEGVIVYTVGFDFSNVENPELVTDLMNDCATSPEHVYLPESGTALRDAFKDIAVQISNLRISM